MTFIQVSQIAKQYAKRDVLKSIEFELDSGCFLTLLGPSGCGKTTLLRIIAGLERADQGQIICQNRQFMDCATGQFLPPQHRKLGFVFQDYGLWPHMNVAENIAFPLHMDKQRQLSKQQIIERVHTALEHVQLTGYAHYKTMQLSGGQKQRVAIARALATQRQLILFDEPLSNLDANLRDELGRQIRSLSKEFGLTCIYVTHDRREAQLLSDQIALMQDGRIHRLDTAYQLFSHPADRWTANFLDCGNIIPGHELNKAAQSYWLLPRRSIRVADPLKADMTVTVEQSHFMGERYEIQARMGAQLIKFYHAYALEIGHQVGIQIDSQQVQSLA